MIPSDNTNCDIDKLQQIDNENYQKKYSKKKYKFL